jgi:hypothetical protein
MKQTAFLTTQPDFTDFTLLSENLDGLDESTLLELGRSPLGVRPIKQARLVFPDRPEGYIQTFKSLRNYAMNKAVAMQLRRDGKIDRAQQYESICETIYNLLPENARW